MMGNTDLDRVISEIQEQLDESEEEQAERIAETAAEYGMDAESLLDAEHNLEQVLKDLLPAETTDGFQQFMSMAGPIIGLDPSTVSDLDAESLATLIAQGAASHPDKLSRAVRQMDVALRRSGTYDDLDISDPRPGEFRSEINVDGTEE